MESFNNHRMVQVYAKFGIPSKEIAERLGLAVNTVEEYRKGAKDYKINKIDLLKLSYRVALKNDDHKTLFHIASLITDKREDDKWHSGKIGLLRQTFAKFLHEHKLQREFAKTVHKIRGMCGEIATNKQVTEEEIERGFRG